MAADGTGQRRLVDLAPDETPAWSPDGTQIAYVRLTDSRARELAVIEVAAQSARVPTSEASATSWSPTGNRIAFRGMGGLPTSARLARSRP
jgi:Tol biopolymer transport system component